MITKNERSLIQKLSFLLREDIETTRIIFKTLSLGKRRIGFKEIFSLTSPSPASSQQKKNLVKEAVLTMCWWRLLLPINKSHNSAWKNSSCKAKFEEVYEVPVCISYVFEKFYTQGVWDYKFAISKYFKEIEEPCKGLILKIVEDILKEAYGGSFVSVSMIKRICKKNGYPEERIGTLIAELKGGGFISPFITLKKENLQEKEKGCLAEEGPVYELNKALFINYRRIASTG